MATGDYCTLTELKRYIWPDGVTPDTTNDTDFPFVITAASRWIDNYCGRRFYSSSTDETRYYSACDYDGVFTDDILSVTSLATDDDGDRIYETSWATTDFDLLPLGAVPSTFVTTAPNGVQSFPLHRRGIRIVGKFGYCATDSHPAAVRQACLMICARTWRRRDAPFGIISNPAGGDMRLVSDVDPDAAQMLEPYRRVV